MINMFRFFKQDKPGIDPYSGFEKDSHFRPRVDKGSFFRLTGSDFTALISRPLRGYIGDPKYETEKGSAFSYGQKALYYWENLDGQVTNGGFVQFYYNGYGRYIPIILKSLTHIGDMEMADLVGRAEKLYRKSKRVINRARRLASFFGTDIYERLDELSALDDEYYVLNKKTMPIIEKYIRANPNEFCVDENGLEFDTGFSGDCITYYPGGSVKEMFTLEAGTVKDELLCFYENGVLQERILYLNGAQTGEKDEFYENGNIKYRIKRDRGLDQFHHQWFYGNGNPQKSEHRLTGKRECTGEYREWYENGHLSKSGTYITGSKRDGAWLEYYSDGSKRIEGEYRDGVFFFHNYWNGEGQQLLKDGTGIYVNEYTDASGDTYRKEQEYNNYRQHGQQKSFDNGVLTLCQEMVNGLPDGLARAYYKNGRIKSEEVYKNGQSVSYKTFSKSENLTGKVRFTYLMKEEWLKEKELPVADTYPVCINEEAIKAIIKTPKVLFEPRYQDVEGATCLWLSVDEKGNVTNVEFRSAYMTNGNEFTKVARIMKFTPAAKDGKPVPSYIYIIASFTVE